MKKRIGIDMREMKPFPTGIGSHYLPLVKALVTLSKDVTFILIVNDRCEEYITKYFADTKVSFEKINVNGGSMQQLLMSFYLRRKYKKLDLDLLLTDIWCSYPLMPKNYALMVYDLIGFNHVVPVSRKQRLFDRFLYKPVALKAKVCIASTTSVQNDLVRFMRIPTSKIAVVMPSVFPEYMQTYTQDEISEVQRKFSLSSRYIMYVGNRRMHKNITGALAVFEKLVKETKDDTLELVLVGSFDTEKGGNEEKFIDQLRNSFPTIISRVRILGRVDDNADVAKLLHGAQALLHTALFEGYGLTPLEAMNCGCPVVASLIPPIRDVVEMLQY